VKVGDEPFDVAVGAGSVWVSNHCGGTVSRIDPRTNKVIETIHVGLHPQWLAAESDALWVGVSGEVYFGTCPSELPVG
jgi:YVTN family beta-propeller protein